MEVWVDHQCTKELGLDSSFSPRLRLHCLIPATCNVQFSEFMRMRPEVLFSQAADASLLP